MGEAKLQTSAGPGEIEIRPLYEIADFAEAMTSEQADREKACEKR